MSRAKCPVCQRMINLDGDVFVAHAGCHGSGTKRVKKGFMDGYKRYLPEIEGFGSISEWMGCFRDRMGFEEAEQIIHGQADTPRGILGVGLKATWDEIKKAYRAAAMLCHPDLCASHGLTKEAAEAAFKRLEAAFTVLEREFGK